MGAYDERPKPADCVSCFFSNVIACLCRSFHARSRTLFTRINSAPATCIHFSLKVFLPRILSTNSVQTLHFSLVTMLFASSLSQRSPTRTSSGVHEPSYAATSGTWRNWCVISSHFRLPVVLLVPFSWWSEHLHSCSWSCTLMKPQFARAKNCTLVGHTYWTWVVLCGHCNKTYGNRLMIACYFDLCTHKHCSNISSYPSYIYMGS